MYNHNLIETRWQRYWLENKVNIFVNSDKHKYYVLDMFPYPSGAGLHVGHLKGYVPTDIIARFKKLSGFDVLHPIGWDAFGLPAEHYAISTGNHPEDFTKKNINIFREQLQKMGFNYDYNKEVNTTDPNYYKWTQWIFSKLFEEGLAEIKDIEVNWCEELHTVLANEEVLIVDGKMVSERGQFPVVKKPMRQWVLKITKYADKLLDGLNDVDWPESLKSIQRNWIGRSIGALVKFKTISGIEFEVFTTRPDTIYGVTFLSIAPENAIVSKLTTSEYKKQVAEYVDATKSKTDLNRKDLQKDKTGVFTGSYVINPISNEKIPVYVADYVLNSYATGIVMGVPGHDQRDYEFAQKYHLPVKFIIETQDKTKANEEDGKHINSRLINGKNIKESSNIIIKYLEEHRLGHKHVSYKLNDWIFSRQRYWGEPFPIIFDDKQKPHLIKELPIALPQTEHIKPTKSGESPLANLTEWLNVEIDGKHYRRETNTMPQWAGSCWYYLAYLMKETNGEYLPLDDPKTKELFKKWLPVDLYVGGQEHAVLHLLYSRFWHRFLYDIGVVPTKEPFQLLINQGMILGPDGEKMSKSRGNVINPNELIVTHGADALRIHLAFMGPLTASLPWSDDGLNGARKWLDRVYRLFIESNIEFTDGDVDSKLDIAFHKFIKQATQDINAYGFNTAISQMMIYINECYAHKVLSKKHMCDFIIVLSCFAPHLAEEIWHEVLKQRDSVTNQTWPKYDESKTIDAIITLPIQENGKLRATINIKKDASQAEVEKLACVEPKVVKFIDGRKPKKVIYVKNKILNFIF